jgi:inorganic triphosphatase YgiF
MSRNREIELKLEAEEASGSALAAHPLLGGPPAKSAEQVSVYFDTPEGALRAAGYSLRVRQAGSRFVQTVKQSSGVAAGLFDRPEWEDEVAGLDLDLEKAAQTPLADLLTKKVRKRLAPLIRVEGRRSTWNLDGRESRLEIVLDEGVVIGGTARQGITELELELLGGDERRLFEIAQGLATDVPLRLGVLTKSERGYRLAEGTAGKAVKSEPIELSRSMNAAEGFAAVAYACLRQFRLNEPLVVETRDPTALHQARVAMRRLRSGFTLFRPVIADDRYEELREEVRWFTNQLGDARNLDVLLKRFGTGTKDNQAAEKLADKLRREREAAYEHVLEALASQRLRTLMLGLVAWIETGSWRRENELAQLPLRHFASLQLDKRWTKVRKGGQRLAEVEPETRHQLRIEVKKLRYAVEFLASLTSGDEAIARQKQFVRYLEDMQEELGELNDLETARTMLANLLQGEPDSDDMMRYASSKLEAPDTEEAQIASAQKAHTQLVEVGRFWR